jgi:hypothetical protein
MRRTLIAGFVIALVAATLVGASAPAQAATTVGTRAQLLAKLPVTAPHPAGYSPYKFISKKQWAAKDRNGCTLVQRMVITAATVRPKVGKKCTITGGSWLTNFGTKTVTDAKQVHVVPVMSFQQAWNQGAWKWTPAQRYAWATNVTPAPTRLRALGPSTLQATMQMFDTSGYADLVDYLQRLPSRLQGILAEPYFSSLAKLQLALMYAGSAQGITTAYCTNPSQTQSATASILNATAWGLTLDTASQATLTQIVTVCPDPSQYLVDLNTAALANTAAGAQQNAPVPAPGPAADGSTVTYTNYGSPTGGTIPASLFGMHAPPDSGYVPSVKYGYLRLWDSAVTWADLQPASGTYNWTKLDDALRYARTAGVSVMYVLGRTPQWARPDSQKDDVAAPPADASTAGAFISALCQHVKAAGLPAITSYEAWNEGNLKSYWTGTPEQLAAVTKSVYDAVKGCEPSSQVLAASGGMRLANPVKTAYIPYLQALGKLGWPIDGYTVHDYPDGQSGPNERVKLLATFKGALSSAGAPVKPVYDTELNYGLAGPSPTPGRQITGDEAMGAISRAYIDSVRYGVDSTFWYLWTGGNYDLLGIQLHSATTDTKDAYNATYTWLVGSRVQRCQDFGTVSACQFSGGGTNFTLLWTTSGTTKVSTAGLGTVMCTLHSVCTPITGNSVQVSVAPVWIGG